MKIIIVHGWGATPTSDWYAWLQEKLTEKGHKVFVPEMPETEIPRIDAWVQNLSEVATDVNGTLFIGHSIGCQTIMRFLQQQDEEAWGCIFFAGWFYLAGLEEEGADIVETAKPWLDQTTLSFGKITAVAGPVKVVLSSNEPYGHVKDNKEVFENRLNAKVVIVENKGHFTSEDGCSQLPEALVLVQDILNTKIHTSD